MRHQINPRHTRGTDCEVCKGVCLYADPAQKLRDQLAENLVVMERARNAVIALRAAAEAAFDALGQYDQIPADKAKELRKQLRAAIVLAVSA